MEVKCDKCKYCKLYDDTFMLCTKDDELISRKDYRSGKKMVCSVNKEEDNIFTRDYFMWRLIRR